MGNIRNDRVSFSEGSRGCEVNYHRISYIRAMNKDLLLHLLHLQGTQGPFHSHKDLPDRKKGLSWLQSRIHMASESGTPK